MKKNIKETFAEVLRKLDLIGADSGKIYKEKLVRAYLTSDEDFRKCVELMLNPFFRFYIKDFDADTKEILFNEGTNDPSLMSIYAIFDSLSARKVSGNTARVLCGSLVNSGFPSDLMLRILNKDPKAGFGASTVNKAMEGLIPEFPYQRCSLPAQSKLNTWHWADGIISQEKADGMYVTFNRTNSNVFIMSRSGKVFNNESFSDLVIAATNLLEDNTQTQGELLVFNSADNTIQPREIGNGMLNKVAQGGDFLPGFYPVYHVWDQIPMGQVKSKVKYNVPYATRLSSLTQQLDSMPNNNNNLIRLIDTRTIYSMQEAVVHFAEMLALGKEGTILSDPSAPWVDGTSKFKVKFKLTATCELQVTGWRKGNGKNSNLFGSLICESEDRLLQVAVSGFSDEMRKEIFANMSNIIGSIISVDSNMLMGPSKEGQKWSLFLPRFVEIRHDKTVADSLDKIKAQFDAAAASAAQ